MSVPRIREHLPVGNSLSGFRRGSALRLARLPALFKALVPRGTAVEDQAIDPRRVHRGGLHCHDGAVKMADQIRLADIESVEQDHHWIDDSDPS